jgi:hypothetical protein
LDPKRIFTEGVLRSDTRQLCPGRRGLQGSNDTHGMSRRQLVFAHVVIGILIIGSYFTYAFDREYWPFSPYPMYSFIYDKNVYASVRLYGVTRAEREVLLRNFDYVQPFSPVALEEALAKTSSKYDSKRGERALDRALRDRLMSYEDLRRAGLHDGPPLQGVRLYEETWQLGTSGGEASRRQLVAEVKRGE